MFPVIILICNHEADILFTESEAKDGFGIKSLKKGFQAHIYSLQENVRIAPKSPQNIHAAICNYLIHWKCNKNSFFMCPWSAFNETQQPDELHISWQIAATVVSCEITVVNKNSSLSVSCCLFGFTISVRHFWGVNSGQSRKHRTHQPNGGW